MDFHKIWQEQCVATHTIRERFGVENALDYLIGEKLLNFAKAEDQGPEFAAELPCFQAACGRFSIPLNSAATSPALSLPPERVVHISRQKQTIRARLGSTTRNLSHWLQRLVREFKQKQNADQMWQLQIALGDPTFDQLSRWTTHWGLSIIC